ncbi:MAG: SHOCT domain-containing protein [Alphaproteobacteria bacterium]|nr:SHOCT domain-containing protein [Alphaproteobacteria bacterium]
MVACPVCSAANAQTAKFCGACGAAMAGAGGGAQPVPPVMPPPMPPPMPPQPPFGGGSRFSVGGMGAMSGGFDAQSIAPMDQRATFDHVARTLPDAQTQVLGQQPPSAFMIEVAYKTLGMAVRYRGTVTLVPQGPQQTIVQAKLGVDWGSTIPTFIAVAVVAVMSAWLSSSNIMTMHLAGFNILFGILGAAGLAWSFGSEQPKKIANQLLVRLAGGGAAAPKAGGFQMPKMDMKIPGMGGGANPFQQQPQQQQPQQQPMQQYAPPPPAAPAAPAAETSPIEQLERLAKLRDSGIVTTEEFEAKKAEILKRL